jgi:hypothetical protein
MAAERMSPHRRNGILGFAPPALRFSPRCTVSRPNSAPVSNKHANAHYPYCISEGQIPRSLLLRDFIVPFLSGMW